MLTQIDYIVLPPNNFQMRPLLTIFVITVQIFYASAAHYEICGLCTFTQFEG